MHTYSFLRELADSWILLAMFAFFIGVILWAFRPGSGATYEAVARIPFSDEAKPKCRGCKGCPTAKGAFDV